MQKNKDIKMAPVSHKIKALNLIPGSGEFAVSSQIMRNQYGIPLNTIKGGTKTFIQATIENLKLDFPNLKKVGLVLGWYADSIEADNLKITPKVEDRTAKTGGSDWTVGEYSRSTAPQVSQVNGKMNWGGTYSDRSVIEACDLLTKNGYEVMLYPMLYIDLPNKPWRGDIKAKTDEGVEKFFVQYNKFIQHYATLKVGDKKITDLIKTIVIGSELKTLTAYRSPNTQKFKVVEKLIELAKDIKATVGKEIKVTYAADWSEYHHTDGGFHPLDALWASPSIDFVGIDAYFPLTDEVDNIGLTYEALKKGWESGINYDYYRDGNGNKQSLSPDWAIKNVEHFYKSYHFDPSSVRTAWMPKMKNITFTEFGCASVQNCASRPYFFQYGKEAKVDNEAQARVIEATIDYWAEKSSQPDNNGLADDIYLYALDVRLDYHERPEMFADASDYSTSHNLKVASIETIGNDCSTA